MEHFPFVQGGGSWALREEENWKSHNVLLSA